MDGEELKEYNEILFSAHSCGIEGNSFSVDDTRELKEKGLGLIPQGKTLYEAFEILGHFKAYEYLLGQKKLIDGRTSEGNTPNLDGADSTIQMS